MSNCIDCLKGVEMGCQAFCCKLLVRMNEKDKARLFGTTEGPNFLEKDEDTGYCKFLNENSRECNSWENRPQVCREYECNSDKMLQVMLRTPTKSIVELSKKAQSMYLPSECWSKIPVTNDTK